MTNSYYNHGSYPVTGAPGASSALRAELDLVTAGFALLPTLSGNANKALVINSGGSAVTVTTGTLALAGNLATTGAYNTTLVQGATTSLTLPLVSGTLATLAGTETLSNKTIAASTLSGTVSGGGNQINNVVIGTSTPLAGTFTTLTSTTALVTSATTDATSITTGALQSAGGLGVTKAIWVGGLANIAGAVTAAAGVSSTLTTDATSATTGSIVTAGGISTQKALWVGGLADIAGVATLGPGAVLNTPASMTATNITGTAAGLTAGNVTTNANLTGDVTSVGNATTLATVASAGSTGSSTAIPVITINAKGLTTGITTAAVIAPAGTLTGATLASNVLASSLTSLGTIATLTATAGTMATTPSGSTDIANKLYVDTVAQGLDAKASCIAATTANITLSGTQTVDGVVLVAADRVLVKNQTASAENGLYLCAAGAWTRTTDADTWDELRSAFVFIEKGTVYADTGWVCTIDSGGTLGTTAVTWAQFSGAGSYTAGTGLTLTGTAFSLTAPVTVALGGTNATSAGITSFNNITGYTASGATGTTSTDLVFSASPTLTGTLTAAAGAFSSTLGVTGATTLSSTLGVTGAATLSSTLGVTGATTLSSTLGVTGATTLSSTLGVTGATTLSSTLGVTGVATFAAGTAAAPAITTSGDTNTGIFFPAADTIAFGEGGAEAVRIDSSGNVGIGTSSPLANLNITYAGNGYGYKKALQGELIINTENSGLEEGPGISFGHFSSTAPEVVGRIATIREGYPAMRMAFMFRAGGSGTSDFSASDERITILSSGNVGIGTSSPGVPLDVSSASSIYVIRAIGALTDVGIRADNTTAGGRNYTMFSSGTGSGLGVGNFNIFDVGANSSRLSINSSGNVGIGTTSPSNPLDVAAATGVVNITSSTGTNYVKSQVNNTGGSFQFAIENSVGGNFGAPAYARVLWNDGAYPTVLYTSSTERMRITSSGDVGIGTSSPSTKLDVAGGIRSSSGNYEAANGSVYGWGAQSAYMGGSSATNVINFLTSSTERMRIDSSGNVGIGTTSPTSFSGTNLHVQSSGASTYGSMLVGSGTYLFEILTNQNSSVMSVGARSNHSLSLVTNDTERMRIDTSGNVGIGTTSPGSKLAVLGSDGTGFTGLTSTNSNGNVGIAGVQFSSDTTYVKAAIGLLRGHPNGVGSLVFYNDINTDAANWATTDEKMRIDSSGNVGIGTSSPGTVLNLSTTDQSTNRLRLQNTGSGGRTWDLVGGLPATNNENFSIYDATAAATRLTIDSSGNVGIGTASPSGGCRLDVRGGVFQILGTGGHTGQLLTDASGLTLKNVSNGYMIFGTNNTERARIDSSGNLLLGCTTQAAAARSSVQTATDNSRFIGFQSAAGAEIGYIFNNTTATQYSTSSDYRLKDNVAPMVGALAKVAALKPVTYKWKADGSDGQGFIAHELQEVVPDCVTGDKDATWEQEYEVTPAVPAVVDEDGVEVTPAVEAVKGTRTVPSYQGVDTSFLVATLVASIQELKAIIDTQATRIAALESK